MATKQAMWVHGTQAQAQREAPYLPMSQSPFSIYKKNAPYLTRFGWGSQFEFYGIEWFHFAIPTPVIFGGKHSTLDKAFILYETLLGAKVKALHIYDGLEKIQEFNGLNYTGDHSYGLDVHNTWIIKPVHIRFGLGLSVEVDFGEFTPNDMPGILFTSAGADFTIP